MTVAAILRDQMTDPFRIGLIVALVATMLRTERRTGRWLPLAAGVAFVAVLIPVTRAPGPVGGMVGEVALGLVANLAILAVALGAWAGWRRLWA